jgi:hypothetical protein
MVLGLINCLETFTDLISIYPLNDHYQYSPTTAEGGAGGADSAGVIYTTAAIQETPKRVLGSLTWEGGLATPGTWNALPEGNELFGKNSKLPGEVVTSGARQVSALRSATFGGATAVLPIDDTIPTDAEGAPAWAEIPIVPTSAANVLQIEAEANLSPDAANEYVAVMAAISNNPASAIAWARSVGANLPVEVSLFFQTRAGSVTTQLWEARLGYTAASTVYMNGQSGARRFGGTLPSTFRVSEIVA